MNEKYDWKKTLVIQNQNWKMYASLEAG